LIRFHSLQEINMRLSLVMLLLAASACKTATPVHKEAIVDRPVVVPRENCPMSGVVAMSTGKPGERMLCELEAPLGSHVPTCTCWDEGLIAQQRDDTQQIFFQNAVGHQTRPGDISE
jgi:hypothetical protein